MEKEDLEKILNNIDLPHPECIKHQQELKIPLFRFKRSSRAGLWLLLLPAVVAITGLIRYDLRIALPFLDFIREYLNAVDRNKFLTYLIPIIFIGFPLLAMIINLLAFCHFERNRETKELLVTIKSRPLNIVIFLFSFAILVFFLLPDRLSF